jgi:cell division protein FtsZ
MSLFEVTEAAEEIRSAADPEANIIFGTSFNERLGEEVAITVIATGFDGKRPGAAARERAASSADAGARAPRDFLEELERQRSQMSDTGVPDAPAARADEAAANGNGNGAREGGRVVEPVGVRRPSYDADDLEIPSFLRRSR